jgi:hypothetical protein
MFESTLSWPLLIAASSIRISKPADCFAVDYVENEHHFTNSSAMTIDATFGAGMDLYNCGTGVVSRSDMLQYVASTRGAKVGHSVYSVHSVMGQGRT